VLEDEKACVPIGSYVDRRVEIDDFDPGQRSFACPWE
jgi:hypothetical protein